MKVSLMINKNIILSFILAILISAPVMAQIEIGASYELRNEEPKSGFGLRVQKGLFEVLPLVDLGIRAHFSYFNEDNTITKDGLTYGGIANYDFGLAAFGGISLGLLQPYVGVGLGSETVNVDRPALSAEQNEDSNLYWNTFAGAKVTVIPLVKPFVEFRYSNKKLGEPELADAQNSRFMVGILLSF